ncbi:MAG: hypothetical protein V7L02_29195 [Nostoc sp.]|uniref:hypothetical protein n=1 Tax=Nostoc sp. TaxID=1180 RepID=UPI002FFA93B5
MIDWDKAFKHLDKDDVSIISDLITVLKNIDEKNGSMETTRLVNKVEKFLKKCLISLDSKRFDRNTSESLEKESDQSWVEDAADYVVEGINIVSNQISCNAEQQQELLKLSYFLQGELRTEEERKYIRTILDSYLVKIDEFRSSPRSQ